MNDDISFPVNDYEQDNGDSGERRAILSRNQRQSKGTGIGRMSAGKWLSINLMVAVGYFTTSWFALFLAIPPGFASAVWPASGLALAAVLVAGNQVAPGIVLGSFCTNLFVASDAASLSRSCLIAGTIGIGAALQAIGGGWLVGRYVGINDPLDSERAIAKFFFFAGPVSCCINPTWSVIALIAYGQIPPDDFLFSWSTWWVGDTIGIFVFTPLTLMVAAPPEASWRARRVSVGVPLTCLFAIAVAYFLLVRHWTNERTRLEFDGSARAIALEVADVMQRNVEAVESLRDFFHSSRSVSPEEFERFTRGILQRHPALQSLEWAPIVAGVSRAAFETEVRKKSVPNFRIRIVAANEIKVSPQKGQYIPIRYVQPLPGNKALLGIDMAAYPGFLPFLNQAEATGVPVATGCMLLNPKKPDRFGVRIAVAIDDAPPVAASPPNAASQKKGFVIGAVRIQSVLREAMKRARKRTLAVMLNDVSEGPASLLATFLPGKQDADNTETVNLESTRQPRPALVKSILMQLAGRSWELTIGGGPEYLATLRSWEAWSVLAIGLTIVSLIGSFLMILTGRSLRIERKVVERTRELADATRRAEAASRAKSEFVSNMSHEIRTPMTAVLGFASLLAEEEGISAEGRDRLETIQRNGAHLLAVINDILDISKIEAGKMTVESIECSVVDLIRDIDSNLRERAAQKGLQAKVAACGPVPKTIRSDPTRLRQVLHNLISNAIKFTSAGQICFTVRMAETGSTDNRLIQFEVADTGIGIASEQAETIFQPFTQADGSMNRNYGGTGLGLTISRAFARMLGGDLTIQSAPGVGSTFTLSVRTGPIEGVPCFDSWNTAPPVAETPVATAIDAPLHGRILVVEDGLDNQRLISFLLKKAGAEISLAENGRVGVDTALAALAAGQPFALILMDMQMPVLDGYEATHALRAQGYAYPIVALTAHALEHEKERCLQAGCNDYCVKPIHRETLVSTARRWMEAASIAAAR